MANPEVRTRPFVPAKQLNGDYPVRTSSLDDTHSMGQ